jgi:hypothetical protein
VCAFQKRERKRTQKNRKGDMMGESDVKAIVDELSRITRILVAMATKGQSQKEQIELL